MHRSDHLQTEVLAGVSRQVQFVKDEDDAFEGMGVDGQLAVCWVARKVGRPADDASIFQ